MSEPTNSAEWTVHTVSEIRSKAGLGRSNRAIADAHNRALAEKDAELANWKTTSKEAIEWVVATYESNLASLRKQLEQAKKALAHYARRYNDKGKCWNWLDYVCDSYSGEVSHFDWRGDEQVDAWDIAEAALAAIDKSRKGGNKMNLGDRNPIQGPSLRDQGVREYQRLAAAAREIDKANSLNPDEQLERCIKALNRLKGHLAGQSDPRNVKWLNLIKEALKP